MDINHAIASPDTVANCSLAVHMDWWSPLHRAKGKRGIVSRNNDVDNDTISPSKKAILAKVGSLGPTPSLDYRQGGLVEFCHQGLQDPSPTGHRAAISAALSCSLTLHHSFPIELAVSSS